MSNGTVVSLPESETIRAAELFAGIGLVRMGLERAGISVDFANDIEPFKRAMYDKNFTDDHFLLEDITNVRGEAIPDVDVVTASFPCTDVSLAGKGAGLAGEHSGLFWQVARILDEMSDRKPPVLMLENVPSLVTSHGGNDLAAIVTEFNRHGYWCDIFIVDARHFVAQSRPRVFIIGFQTKPPGVGEWSPSAFRPARLCQFASDHPALRLHPLPLPELPAGPAPSLNSVVERLAPSHQEWWEKDRAQRFIDSMSAVQRSRLDVMQHAKQKSWATAYRRTRNGIPTWEMRADSIAGCLRTTRGGSSKQAVVEAGDGEVRIRWMTPREYARLQGAPDYNLDGIRPAQATFGFGDAVCVPAIAFIATHFLVPLVNVNRSAKR